MRLVTLFLVTFCLFQNKANADLVDIFYVKGQVGMVITTDGTIGNTDVDYDIAAPYPITIGAGMYFSPLFSLALEINYETQELQDIPDTITNDDRKELSGFLNLYFHLPKLLLIEPFIGVGAGYTTITIEENDYETDGFSWHVGAGFDYDLSSLLSLVFEARLETPVGLELEGAGSLDREDIDYTKAKLLVGLKLNF